MHCIVFISCFQGCQGFFASKTVCGKLLFFLEQYNGIKRLPAKNAVRFVGKVFQPDQRLLQYFYAAIIVSKPESGIIAGKQGSGRR